MAGTACGGSPTSELNGWRSHSDGVGLRSLNLGAPSRAMADLVQLCGAFPETPILIGGDFNVTLVADDRPNGEGGRDPGSGQFREVLAQLGLAEMGPSNRRFTWRSQIAQSRLDRFLCSTKLLALVQLAEVISLPRPLSDHMHISWSAKVGPCRPTYFKMDWSWLRDGGFKRDI